MIASDPRREQQMDQQVQQDLGNGLFWAYFAIADAMLFMGALISALERNHAWPWFLLAFLVSVSLTYEWGRYRSRKLAVAASQPAEPLPLPTPDPHWRRRTVLHFIAPTLFILLKIFSRFEPWKLWLLMMLPIAFALRWVMQGQIEAGIEHRREQILAQDFRDEKSAASSPARIS